MTPVPSLTYKVVETSTVTDEELEKILNRHCAEGWIFDGFHFVTRESSRRPAMAFVLFRLPAGGKASRNGAGEPEKADR